MENSYQKVMNGLDKYKKLTYNDLDSNRKEMLNLVDLNDLDEFINFSFN